MADSENLVFKIGEIGLGLSFGSGWKFAPLGRFPDFSNNCTPQANYIVSLQPGASLPRGELIFDSGQTWRLFSVGDRRILWIVSRNINPRLVGNFSQDYHRGEISVTINKLEGNKYLFPFSYPLGQVLMTSLLGTGYGIMLHSCGVVDDKNGFLFAGISTNGKTTTARLWNADQTVRVLNDDRNILRKINGQFKVYGTPWPGEGGFALADDAPLKKIFILKHAPLNQAVRLSPARAAAALLVRTFAPLWDASAMAYTLHFLDDLCQTVPCYELGFVPNQSAVEYVRCLT